MRTTLDERDRVLTGSAGDWMSDAYVASENASTEMARRFGKTGGPGDGPLDVAESVFKSRVVLPRPAAKDGGDR